MLSREKIMKMRDTEGAKLPVDDDRPSWDMNLWGDGEMSMRLPFLLDMGEEYYEENGAHVVSVSLREILEEHLCDYEELDGGEGLKSLAALLVEYAGKYKAASTA